MRRDALGRPDYVVKTSSRRSLRHRFAYSYYGQRRGGREDFQHALDMSAAIELGNESPRTSSDDDDGEDQATTTGKEKRRMKIPSRFTRGCARFKSLS